jgi:hypothetical protein
MDNPRIIYISILIIILLLILYWYLYVTYEGMESIDDITSSSTSCPNPELCKSEEERRKDTNRALVAQAKEMSKPKKSPVQMKSFNLQLQLTNTDENNRSISYSLPNKKIVIPTPNRSPSGFGVNVISPAQEKIIKTKELIRRKILSSTRKDINMLDVDLETKGIVKPPLYEVTSISLNNPASKTMTSMFNETIPRNTSLSNIYKRKKSFIQQELGNVSLTSNDKYTIPVQINSTTLPVDIDTGNHNNNLMIITPKTNDTFPNQFTMTIVNNTENNKYQLDLWGDFFNNENKKRPPGNANVVLNKDNLTDYFNKGLITIGYNKTAFGDSCFKITDNYECPINGLDIGDNAINIIESGNIFNSKGKVIGSIKHKFEKSAKQKARAKATPDSTTDDLPTDGTHTLTITNGEGITGILLYLAYPTT